MTATAKKQKPLKRHPSKLKKMSAYMILTLILISIVAVLFAFPLYWIITGSFKTRNFSQARAHPCGSWPCPSATLSARMESRSISPSAQLLRPRCAG